MDFLTILNETEEEFEIIAQTLFDNFAIRTYNSLYRLTENEFYWNSTNHVDNSTYKRKHVDPKTGDWFFHYSGVDIALKNEETGGYGGILMRSIYDIDLYRTKNHFKAIKSLKPLLAIRNLCVSIRPPGSK